DSFTLCRSCLRTPAPSLGKRGDGVLKRRGVAVHGRVHIHGLPTGAAFLEEAPDAAAVGGDHVKVAIIPRARRAAGRCTFEAEGSFVVSFRRARSRPVALAGLSGFGHVEGGTRQAA